MTAKRHRVRGRWLGVMIAATLALCAILLAFRNDIRGRYWAYRAAESNDLAQRAQYLNLLIGAGDSGAWGIGVLARDARVHNRELAALALQTRRAGWAREILVELLSDQEESVRDLAVLALATIRDAKAMNLLMAMYSYDDTEEALRAQTACVGLQRMGGFSALQALSALVEVKSSAAARGALVDALLEVGGSGAVADLMKFLDDHRPCPTPSYQERMAWLALGGAGSAAPFLPRETGPQSAVGEGAAAGQTGGAAGDSVTVAATQPSMTVAERAAAALGDITGRKPPFSSAASEAERRAAIEEWLSWRP
ncbi:MAG: HEAT repeat domain-containing protein [Phycisphaerales bacterium]|nr:HEAT repeat domain-containing protein [Phycisphaerales bacterium]